MRIWSLHPIYLDGKGLVAVWREGLLARAVLRGATRGYRHHPQLDRFRSHAAPVSAINSYLRAIASEADARGYRFDWSKIGPVRNQSKIAVTYGQLEFEIAHLRTKVHARARSELDRLPKKQALRCHPLFFPKSGPIEPWERNVVST